MITKETIEEIAARSKGRCENPFCGKVPQRGEHHHIWWRSQYKGTDRDESWNLLFICPECHYKLHNQEGGTLDKVFKAIAAKRKPLEQRSGGRHKDLDTQKKRRRAKYLKEIAAFKKDHDGLSPTQVKYRQAKEYRRKYGINLQ